MYFPALLAKTYEDFLSNKDEGYLELFDNPGKVYRNWRSIDNDLALIVEDFMDSLEDRLEATLQHTLQILEVDSRGFGGPIQPRNAD